MSEKCEFIDAQCADMPVGDAGDAPGIMQMCEWLGVSRSGYYGWRSRPESATARTRELRKVKIKAGNYALVFTSPSGSSRRHNNLRCGTLVSSA